MSLRDGSTKRAMRNLGQANDVDLALGGEGVTPEMLNQIVTSPYVARLIAGVLSGNNVPTIMTKDDWVGNELAELAILTEWGMPPVDHDRVAKSWEENYGFAQLYIPGGLTRELLFLQMTPASGTKCYDKDIIPNAEMIPTEEGIFICDLARIMTPTDKKQRPFNLDYAGHLAWAKEQGGFDLLSGEEFNYLLLRAIARLGFVPYMGGWSRCRNRFGSSKRLNAKFYAVSGFRFYTGSDAYSYWYYGTVARKFKPLAA